MPSKSDKNRKREAERKAQAKRESTAECGARKRSGGICGLDAGWGTDHPGTGRCKHHTGSTRSGEISAAIQEMNGMAVPSAITPSQALNGVMCLAAGQLLFATNKVAELKDDELYIKGDRKDSGAYEMIPHKWVALQQACMDRLAGYAKKAADAGIAERAQGLAEAQTAMVAHLIERVMDDVGLSAKQKKQVGPAIRRNLELVVDNSSEREAA